MKTLTLEDLQKEKETLSANIQALNGEINKLSNMLNEVGEQKVMTNGALQFVEQQIQKLNQPEKPGKK